jgi:hypothetical protein
MLTVRANEKINKIIEAPIKTKFVSQYISAKSLE